MKKLALQIANFSEPPVNVALVPRFHVPKRHMGPPQEASYPPIDVTIADARGLNKSLRRSEKSQEDIAYNPYKLSNQGGSVG